MNHWQKFITLLIGFALGVAIYLFLGLGSANILSRYGIDYFVFSGLASVPLIVAAMTAPSLKIWSALLGIVLAVAMLAFCFSAAFVAGLPGSDFNDAGIARLLLCFSLLNAVVLFMRLAKALAMLTVATAVTVLAAIVAMPWHMRSLIDSQLAKTVADGGCAFAGSPPNRRVRSASDLKIGLFVGHHSERLVFVERSGFYPWAYSQLSVSSRRTVPVPAHVGAYPELTLDACKD